MSACRQTARKWAHSGYQAATMIPFVAGSRGHRIWLPDQPTIFGLLPKKGSDDCSAHQQNSWGRLPTYGGMQNDGRGQDDQNRMTLTGSWGELQSVRVPPADSEATRVEPGRGLRGRRDPRSRGGSQGTILRSALPGQTIPVPWIGGRR
jgi:hypothetical protein